MQAERIGFFIECYGVLLAGFTITDNDAWQAIVTLHPDQMSLIGRMRKDQPSRYFGDDFFPVFLLWCRCRCAHDFEIFGAIDIGQNEKLIATGRDIVFDARFAGHDQLRFCRWIVGRQRPAFRSLVIMNIDEDEVIERRASDAKEETGILFLKDQLVLRLCRPDLMVEDL